MINKIYLVMPIVLALGCADDERHDSESGAVSRQAYACLVTITNRCNRMVYEQCKTNAIEMINACQDTANKQKLIEDIASQYLKMDIQVAGDDYLSYEIAVRRHYDFAGKLLRVMRGVVDDEARFEFRMARWRKFKHLCFVVRPFPKADGESDKKYWERKSCTMNLYASYVNETMTIRSYMSSRKISCLSQPLQERLISQGKDLLEYPSQDKLLRSFHAALPPASH